MLNYVIFIMHTKHWWDSHCISASILGRLEQNLPPQRFVSSFGDAATEAAHCFTLAELEEATRNFEKKVGSGGFGVVYYGKLKDGKEIAVKVLTNNSFQGKREFSNEVSRWMFLLYSRSLFTLYDI